MNMQIIMTLMFLTVFSVNSWAVDEGTQNSEGNAPEDCSMSITTAAAVTQDNLESGVSDDTAIFGTVTGTCNSEDGFRYQIKADGDICEFKHGTIMLQ